MGYEDPEFWRRYRTFVFGSMPRHRQARNALGFSHYESSVFDLGCGKVNEARYLFVGQYAGIDVDPDEGASELNIVRGDYRGPDVLEKAIRHLEAFGRGWSRGGVTMFASLFSTELTASSEVNRALYERCFDLFPNADHALVSGMYYRERYALETVQEEGGLVSYQSKGPLYGSAVFEETRYEVAAPSSMFGPDVVEVWRLLERR